MRKMSPITAHTVKPGENYWLTARYRVYSRKTGRALSTNWRNDTDGKVFMNEPGQIMHSQDGTESAPGFFDKKPEKTAVHSRIGLDSIMNKKIDPAHGPQSGHIPGRGALLSRIFSWRILQIMPQ